MDDVADEASDEGSLYSQTHLCEAALQLLAALGAETRFPDDLAGVSTLVNRATTGRASEAMAFAVEPPDALPRYTGEFLVWVSPAADGCLRLRHEYEHLHSEAVVLKPNGRLGAFETISEFGVPDSELTEQARADRETVQRLMSERDADDSEYNRQIDEDQRRFRTKHLVGVRSAPPHDGIGPIVTFIAFYDTGLIVYYLVPHPPDEELEIDDPWADPLEESLFPQITLSDGLGTSYEVVDSNAQESNAPILRASQSFVPAIPANAKQLSIALGSTEVEIELGTR